MTPFYLAYRILSPFKRKMNRILDPVINKMLTWHFSRETGGRLTYQRWRRLPAETADRWASKPSSNGRLTVVVVTYKQPEPLRCLLSSLRCQTVQNFDVIVLHDGADEETGRVVAEHTELFVGPCRYVETDQRYNDYGHSLRAIGLSQATGEFVLITNGDNYYSPRFVEFAFNAVDLGRLDLVLWDIVHSYHNVSWDNAACTPFDCYPLHFRIDMGAFFVRTSLAQAVGFRSRSHEADAEYLVHLMYVNPGPLRMGKVEKTLMVHN